MKWEIPATLPIVEDDPETLAIVLDNLINDAIKFTASGSVTVSFRDFPHERGNSFIVRLPHRWSVAQADVERVDPAAA